MVDGRAGARLQYLNVTDHSPAVGFGMGLDAGRLRAQIERVRGLAATLEPDFTLLVGCEVDILRDGSLDYSDELLAELDVVVASVHASHRLSAADQTEARVRRPREPARRHARPPHRPPASAGAIPTRSIWSRWSRRRWQTGTVLEVSCQPDRLDLRDVNIRLAVEAGAMLVDRHRRALGGRARLHAVRRDERPPGLGIGRGQVVNTREWPELRKLLKDGRAGTPADP